MYPINLLIRDFDINKRFWPILYQSRTKEDENLEIPEKESRFWSILIEGKKGIISQYANFHFFKSALSEKVVIVQI